LTAPVGGQEIGEYTYNGSVANKALELLGKEIGMFVDRKEVGSPGEFARTQEQDLDAFIEAETKELYGKKIQRLNGIR
jgi:hypothetical protein